MKAELRIGPLYLALTARRYPKKCVGVMSEIPKTDLHAILLDFDYGRPSDSELQMLTDELEAPAVLLKTQKGYHYVCACAVPFQRYHEVWASVYDYIDPSHIVVSLARKRAVLRLEAQHKNGDIRAIKRYWPAFLTKTSRPHYDLYFDNKSHEIDSENIIGPRVMPFVKYRATGLA